MNNLSSYCGLVDAKIRASEKDLPVDLKTIKIPEILVAVTNKFNIILGNVMISSHFPYILLSNSTTYYVYTKMQFTMTRVVVVVVVVGSIHNSARGAGGSVH